MHLFLIILVIWWLIGSCHTAAMTAANVLVNRAINLGSKARYVIFGGPPVWIVCLGCGLFALCLSAVHRIKNRDAKKT